VTTRRTTPAARKTATPATSKPEVKPAVAKTQPVAEAPEQQKTAEEILKESPALQSKIEKLGSQKVLKKLKKAAQESSLKPFQAEFLMRIKQ